MKSENRMPITTLAILALAWVSLAPNGGAAPQWFDAGTAAGCQPATNGVMSWADASGDSIWANSAAGTNVPVAWGSGNDAFFTAVGNSTVTVNTATAGALNFSAGTWFFLPGSGNLTINSGITNSQAVLFGNGITLGANQTWYPSVTTSNLTVTGAITGACSLAKSGNGALVFSNANNVLAGLVVNSGTLQAFNGGNALGGSSAAVTLGQSNQISQAVLQLDTTAAGVTTFAMGSLTNAGVAQLKLNTAAVGSTNILAANSLARVLGVGATLVLLPQNGLGTREQLTFSSAPAPVNGMLNPWIVDGTTANFITYGAAGLTDVVYDATQTGTWDSTKKVNITGAATVNQNTNVFAMRVGANVNVTVNPGIVLSNASGGFIITNGNILGAGTISVGTNELVAYVTSASVLAPVIGGSGGLTLFGGGTLALSNITYTGDTWINQGTLTATPATDQTYAGAINGLGTLAFGGSGTLTLTGTNTLLSGCTANTGFKLGLNGRLATTNTVTFWTTTGNSGLVTSTNANGQGGTWDLNRQTLNIGQNSPANNNQMTINNVTFTNVGGVGIGNPSGNNVGGSSCSLTVSNGARFFSGGISVGGSGGNFDHYNIGGGSNPTMVVNGSINVGMAYRGGAPNVDCSNATMTVTNANLTTTSLIVGNRESYNCAASVYANTLWNMSGGALTIGTLSDTSSRYAEGGAVMTIDSGVVTNAGAVSIGAGYSASIPAFSNTLSIVNGGQFYSGNIALGKYSADSNNAYKVGGYGAASTVSNGTITLNYLGTLTATNANLWSSGLTFGNSSSNAVTVQSGVAWNFLNGALTFGNGTGNAFSVVSDGSSMLTNIGGITISDTGRNLSITNASGVRNMILGASGALNIGNTAGLGNDTLTINHQAFTSTTGSTIGNASSNNALTLLADTLWRDGAQALVIGKNAATGNVLTVNGGMATNVGAVTIGNGSAGNNAIGNTLNILNGSQFYSGNVTIGSVGGDSNNACNIGGSAGTSFASVGSITINSLSSMTVSNAAFYSSGTVAVGSASSNNTISVCAGAVWNVQSGTVRIGGNGSGQYAAGNAFTINGGIVTNADQVYAGFCGSGGAVSGNQLIITNGGQLYANRAYSGNSAANNTANSNSVLVVAGGLLEANSINTGLSATPGIGNTFTNAGGIFQFTSSAPTIGAYGGQPIVLNGGTLSFRAITNADVCCNRPGNAVATNLMTWFGNNAFRLAAASNATSSSQTYVFDPSLGATNFSRLEMVGGSTCYRGQSTNSLTIGTAIGSGGQMYCSNTAALVTIPFTNNGTLTIINSTLTFATNAVMNGTVTIDMNRLGATNGVLLASRNLTLGTNSTLVLTGTVTNQTLGMVSGTLSGKFSSVQGLPGNYALSYQSGQIALRYTPRTTVIFFQ